MDCDSRYNGDCGLAYLDEGFFRISLKGFVFRADRLRIIGMAMMLIVCLSRAL